MSLFSKHYYKAKELGEKIGWTHEQINEHAVTEAKEELTNLVREVVDAFNCTAYKTEAAAAILDGINTSHRQLQAEFWEGMIKMMSMYSQQEDRFFDGRNEVYKVIIGRMAKVAFDPDYGKEESV